MNKVIFLDIDGPVIPIDVPTRDSVFRTVCNKDSIEYLNLLCDETGAKVVTTVCTTMKIGLALILETI